ncbi:hypothetical protein GGI20_004001, partial [Coemansia sp. BCRC 34301]
DDTHYQHVDLVIEAKTNDTDATSAVEQIIKYMQNMLAQQHDRRYAIGLTICNTMAKFVICSPSLVVASTAMNLGTRAGCESFIRLMVDLSVCSVDMIGLDSSMQRLDMQDDGELLYRMRVANMDYFAKCIQPVEYIIGDYLRRFDGWADEACVGNPQFLVQDSWPLTNPNGDARNEVDQLHRIHTEYGGNEVYAGMYPTVHLSGRVYQPTPGGAMGQEDTTAALFAGLHDDRGRLKQWGRTHQRDVLGYVGVPTLQCENVHEFIIAVVDALTMCTRVYEDTGILYRNIDIRNIFFQVAGGVARGCLIGYGDALDTRAQVVPGARAEMHQPLVLRPILSLERVDVPHTILFAIESLLYLVFWMAIFGVRKSDRINFDGMLDKNLNIKF